MAVYFARAEGTDFVKIGFAVTVSRRIAHLQSGCPYCLTIVRVVKGDRRTESAFHNLFAEHHHDRDWFKWTPSMATAEASPSAWFAEITQGVNVKALAVASGVPVRTLYRWAEEDRIPGRDAEQKFWMEKIQAAARKLQSREAA